MIATTIQLIERQAGLTPNKTAVSYKDAELSYQELNKRANQLAGYLIAQGIVKGNIVGIAVDRSLELLVTLLAVFKAGAAYVPLDPEYPNQRLEYMLNDSEAAILITNSKYTGELNTQAKVLVLEDVWAELDAFEDNPRVEVMSNDLAYVLYTSGSTGRPKGVMVEHGSLYNLIKSVQHFPGLESHDKLLSLTTISFDISALELFLPLTVGATLFINDADFAKDGEAILNLIKQENISFIQATPSTYKMMLAAEWEEICNIKAICCGEQLPKDLAEKILDKCARLYNMYGPTETTIYSTGKEILANDEVITIGKPIDNTQVFILSDQQQMVQEGEIGEICIAGDGLARGYFGNPEKTAEKFITANIGDLAIKLYRTGDLGKILENGEIQCFGRIDHQIKIRGYRIETGEIEYFLTQQQNIAEAMVTSWMGPSGDPRIAAYIVPSSNVPPQEISAHISKWRTGLRLLLPFYMIPNDFILMDAFPLTENGKVDRKKLPIPNINSVQTNDDALPRNPLEVLIAKVWTDNLGINQIGIHENFFDLGGHSLTAVKVVVQIKKESGKYLPLGSLFKNPTIAELAALLTSEQSKSTFESLVPLKPNGNKPPLYMIHGLGSTVFKFYDFAHQLHEEQPVYGLQARGIDATERPAESIEEMASQYIAEIVKQNPDGPYAFAGYSLGGLVAFEMSRQLEQMGKKVSFLGMIDTFIIKNHQLDEGFYKSTHKVFSRIAKFFYTFYLLASEPKRTIDYKLFTLKRSIQRLRGLEVGNENGLDEDFTNLDKLSEIHALAEANYKLKYFDRDIHLFKAKKAATYMNDFKLLGWKPYVRNVIIHIVGGDHLTMFDDNYSQGFADTLQEVIDDSQ